MSRSAADLTRDWQDNPRWKGVQRGYAAADVVRLRGTVHIEHSLARLTSEKLWQYVNTKPFVNALGALTGTSRQATNARPRAKVPRRTVVPRCIVPLAYHTRRRPRRLRADVRGGGRDSCTPHPS